MLKEEILNSAKKIEEMLEMQVALNNAIMEEKKLIFGGGKFNGKSLERAIIDEVGELNHELKSDWCWWKSTQKPKDNQKVLEELVDVWHFSMSKYYLTKFAWSDERQESITYILLIGVTRAEESKLHGRDPIISFMASNLMLDDVVELTFALGFDIEQVYDAYIEKNKENYDRLKRGY